MIEVGSVVTECMYSDRICHDVIRRTLKTLTLRRRREILDKKPVMTPGGFAGIVVESAKWHTESDVYGNVTKAYLRKDGKFHGTYGHIVEGDNYYYDYGF